MCHRVYGAVSVVLVGLVFAALSNPAHADKPKKGLAANDGSTLQFRELAQKLREPVQMPTFDPNTPLEEPLEFLREKYKVQITIDNEAFRNDLLIEDVEKHPIKWRETEVSLRHALETILSQTSGTYLVRGHVIVITTPQRVLAELNRKVGPVVKDKGNQVKDLNLAGKPELVQAVFDKTPLDKALVEVGEWTDGTIILDPKVGKKSTIPISCLLRNVPVDTAVRMIAGMAGLNVVVMDNVFFVTTKKHAKLGSF